MKIKIISDGTLEGTSVVNAKTGEKVEGIVSIIFGISGEVGRGKVTLGIQTFEAEITGDAKVDKITPKRLSKE